MTPDERERLILDAIPIARRAAGRMRHGVLPSEDPEDDIQGAVVGAIRAVDTWNPDGGSAWASWIHYGAMLGVQAERRRRRGASYDRAVRKREFHESSLSLDATRDDETLTLADTLAAAPLVDEAETVSPEAAALWATLTDRERLMCSTTARDAAEALGVQRGSVLKARHRLYERLRRETAA